MAVDEVTSVYVGGLPYEANEDMLRDAFEYYGTIVSVKVRPALPPTGPPLFGQLPRLLARIVEALVGYFDGVRRRPAAVWWKSGLILFEGFLFILLSGEKFRTFQLGDWGSFSRERVFFF